MDMKGSFLLYTAAVLTLSLGLTACAGSEGGQISPPDESGAIADHPELTDDAVHESDMLPDSGSSLLPNISNDHESTDAQGDMFSPEGLTMNDFYEVLYEDSTLLRRQNQGPISATALRNAGLSTLDTEEILDAVIDTEWDADPPYVLAMFQLKASTEPAAFAANLYRIFDRSMLGEDCRVHVMHHNDIVLLCATTEDTALQDFITLLNGKYQMEGIEERTDLP